MMEGFCQLEMQDSEMMDCLNVTTEIKFKELFSPFHVVNCHYWQP